MKLLNGTVIEKDKDDRYPALQNIIPNINGKNATDKLKLTRKTDSVFIHCM